MIIMAWLPYIGQLIMTWHQIYSFGSYSFQENVLQKYIITKNSAFQNQQQFLVPSTGRIWRTVVCILRWP